MASKYVWRPGMPRPKIEADIFGREVERLSKALGRPPTSKDVLELASSPASAIHGAFEWDDPAAADSWRLDQAGAFLRGLMLVRVRTQAGQATSGRAFYSVRTPEGRGYATSDRVFSDRDLSAQVIEAAQADLARFIERYRHALAMASIIPTLESVIDTMKAEAEALKLASQKPLPKRRKAA